jgi:quercetin dioxygenase-like cupin family protein
LWNWRVCRDSGFGTGCGAYDERRCDPEILSQTDGPVPGYVTLLVEAIIEAGTPVGRHTHPGIESAYFLEGGFELPVQGQETRMMKAGDAVQIPAETAHGGGKAGDARTKVLITYVVQKDKPLASPA